MCVGECHREEHTLAVAHAGSISQHNIAGRMDFPNLLSTVIRALCCGAGTGMFLTPMALSGLCMQMLLSLQ